MALEVQSINAESLYNKRLLRPQTLHKGQMGKALLLTGSLTYPGAALLSLEACLRSGVGYAHLLCAKELIPHFVVKLPSALYQAQTSLETSTQREDFCKLIHQMDAVLIGSGCSLSELTELELELCLLNVDNLLIDADALTILAKWQTNGKLQGLLKKRSKQNLKPILLLPHLGELKRLYAALANSCQKLEHTKALTYLKEALKTISPEQGKLTEPDLERLAYALIVSQSYQAYVVVKGAPTYLLKEELNYAAPENSNLTIYQNTSGCNALAKAGSGDVLAGLLAGLMAQDLAPDLASQLSVYVHGAASEILSQASASRSILPSDLLAVFGQVFQSIGWD